MEAQAPAAKHKAPPPGEEPQPEHLIPAWSFDKEQI